MANWGIAITFGIAITCAALLSGCTKEGLLEPPAPLTQASENTIEMIKLPETVRLQKWTEGSCLITAKDGGELKFEYEDKTLGNKHKFKVEVSLKFNQWNVSNDFVASMGLDATYLMSTINVEFGPHGTEFLRPAILSVKIEGLDLSMYKPRDAIHLYYDEGGVWVKMVAKVTFDPKKGTLECKDGELPHFSRYCFGR